MKKKEHIVKTVKPGSIAEELEIAPGDKVLAIDNTEIEDIFDYQFLTQDTYIEMLVEKPDGEQWLLEIDKEFDEDMGIEFENGLMDEYRHCHNKCIFCFTVIAITNAFSALSIRCRRACVILFILRMMIPDYLFCREIM